MFLAYKSISQKPREFFRGITNKNHFRGEENSISSDPFSSKENLQPDCPTNGSESMWSNNLSENINMCIEQNCNEDDDNAVIFDSNGTHESKSLAHSESQDFENYGIYFDLVKHISHLSIQEVFERMITSLFLLNCLEATSYFSSDIKSGLNINTNKKHITIEERLMFAELLFNAHSIMFCNVHSISEIDSVETQKDLKSESNSGITRASTGIVLFPKVASMMNHSCDPNTACFYANGKIQVR